MKTLIKNNTAINKKAKIDSKVEIDPKLDQIKDIQFKSDKPNEVNKHEFKLNF